MKPIRLRASSVGTLLDCSARWQAIHLEGRSRPASGAARLGTAIHAGTAEFDRGVAHNAPIRVAEAVEATMATLHDKTQEEVDWSDWKLKDAEQVGALLTTRYCQTYSPMFKYAAVELELKPMVIECGDGIAIELTGTMDRARVKVDEKGLGVTDIKTGARAVDSDGRAATKGHSIQLGVYSLLLEHTLGEPVNADGSIVGMRTAKSNPGIGVAHISNVKSNLVGTPEEPGALDYAALLLKSGVMPGNPRSQLCSDRYCPAWSTCRWKD